MSQVSSSSCPLDPWHQTVDACAVALDADVERGLSSGEAARRLAVDGPNEWPAAPPRSPLTLFLSQFSTLIVWVLVAAAVVSGLLQDWLDAAAILTIVLLNGLLGFVQEFRAERSLAVLRDLVVAMAHVVRDGVTLQIPARELVRGDLVLLEAGDRVPADARVSYATNFQTQEASLTGESTPVAKSDARLPANAVALADRRNMVFMGTVAVSGKARALVVQTGLGTELGRIASMIQRAEQAERAETPLQRRLEQFGVMLVWLAFGVVAVVFGLGLLRGEPLVEMFLTAVSLAVAAVPEGLPAVVTITLALGVTRMVGRHALIRKLPAVETLGSATVICTDKTGTLTKNEMTVTMLSVGGQTCGVSGEGYAPVGAVRDLETGATVQEGPCRDLLSAAVLCNGAQLREAGGIWSILGDPTEGALLVAAVKAGIQVEALQRRQAFLGEVPFDPERKRMTVVRRTPDGPVAFVKGAPDVLLRHCTQWLTARGTVEPLTDAGRALILERNAAFAHQALRVLGVARRPLAQAPAGFQAEELERDLVFLGLAAMKDPLRPEVRRAVSLCRDAGIRTVMITGDHKETALAIAQELGLADGERQALTGGELDRLSDEQLASRIEEVRVYARVSAEHKLRIVKAWQARGAVVAMTGDGVNDAPAVKAADIGVAMGQTGTDVTKEAADMVVTDDNFASIAAAVEEGRGIFDNIRKTIHFLLSCNMSEVLVMLFAALLGWPLPLLPIHILWMNLVTDGFPALALAVDPKSPDLMRRRPRRPDDRLIDRDRLLAIGGQGLLLALTAAAAFGYSLYGWHQEIEQSRTVAFTVMVTAQLVHAFNCRNERLSIARVGVATNGPLLLAVLVSLATQVAILTVPPVAAVFKVAPLPWEDWLLIGAMGLAPLVIVEGLKAWRGQDGDRGVPVSTMSSDKP